MPGQLPPSARSLVDFFSRSLSSFQSSSSKLQVICTAAAATTHQHGEGHGPPAAIPPRARPRTLIVLDSSFNPPTRAHLRMATSAIHDLTRNKGQKLGTLRLLLLLSVNNADKAPKPAAFDKRLAMMWAFARDLQQSLRGAQGPLLGEEGEEPPPSVDLGLSTLPYFHEKSVAIAELGFYNGEGDGGDGRKMEQVFLVGYDTLIRIFNPKYYGPVEAISTEHAVAKATAMQKALDPFFARSKLRVTMRTGDEWGNADEQKQYLEDMLKAGGLSKVGGSEDWGSRIEMVEGREVGADIISSTYARAAAEEKDMDKLELMITLEVRWWIEQEALYAQ